MENLKEYGDKLVETGGVVKNKFWKWKNEVKDMKTELPNLKQVVGSIEIGGLIKSKLFKKW